MRNFYKLHSYNTGEFLGSWVDKYNKFMIQREVTEGYGLICLTIGGNSKYVEDYWEIPWEKKRNTTLRECYTQYLKLVHEL